MQPSHVVCIAEEADKFFKQGSSYSPQLVHHSDQQEEGIPTGSFSGVVGHVTELVICGNS